jgi:regulator of protease activity HflC (stomatin/prohibitin superfamily)
MKPFRQPLAIIILLFGELCHVDAFVTVSPSSSTSNACTSPIKQSSTQCGMFRTLATIAAIAVPAASIKIVNQGDVAIVERLGKFHAILNPGFHLIIPIVDRLRTRLSQREQVFDIPPQACISQDNAPLSADAVVYWRVVDPNSAYYSVTDLRMAIQNLVLTQLRSEIGKLTLDATFSAREQINSVLLKDLDVATEPWGVKITRVEVRDIIPNRDIMKAMEMQMAAERTKRAVVIKSEGELAKAVNQAQGLAQSQLIEAKASAEAVRIRADAKRARLELEAEGAAKAINALALATGGKVDEAIRIQLTREYIEAQRALAVSANAKVIISPDALNDAMVKTMALYDVSTTPLNNGAA